MVALKFVQSMDLDMMHEISQEEFRTGFHRILNNAGISVVCCFIDSVRNFEYIYPSILKEILS